MKVIGIGLNKTGTTSLGVCFRHYGLRNRGFDEEAFRLWRDGDVRRVLDEYVAAYDALEDWPWPLIYREIDAAFPGTKFVLTVRRDACTWFESLCKHAERTGPTEFRRCIYGHAMPHGQREAHQAFYESHNEGVRRYFAGRGQDFVELCWEHGDGWDELSAFLGLPRPTLPFPHAYRGRY